MYPLAQSNDWGENRNCPPTTIFNYLLVLSFRAVITQTHSWNKISKVVITIDVGPVIYATAS